MHWPGNRIMAWSTSSFILYLHLECCILITVYETKKRECFKNIILRWRKIFFTGHNCIIGMYFKIIDVAFISLPSAFNFSAFLNHRH